jgi:dihydroorotate dehydrogenase
MSESMNPKLLSACYRLSRPALFQLGPETAHHWTLATLQALAHLGPLNPVSQNIGELPREVMGLRFRNPVGLAAGMDKDGDCIDGFGALGFGFLELGTVTPRPQPGNPRPRLFRLPPAEALINRMGFNNKGVSHLVERVKATRYPGILGINIGKNLSTPVENALSDYLDCLRQVYPIAGYIAINISSPNTPGLRDLQRGTHLDRLLGGLSEERAILAQTHGRAVPIAVKIAPDLDPSDLRDMAGAIRKHHVDAVIATNTTADREGVQGLAHGDETGGLSGRPLFKKSTDIVARLADSLGSDIPIIACGGVFSGADARAKIAAGASLVQVYSGLIYTGPAIVSEIVDALR